jgi:hypothetical protein
MVAPAPKGAIQNCPLSEWPQEKVSKKETATPKPSPSQLEHCSLYSSKYTKVSAPFPIRRPTEFSERPNGRIFSPFAAAYLLA